MSTAAAAEHAGVALSLDATSGQTPLRIAILGSRGFPSTYGGFETFVRHLAPAWVANGHAVTVYCRERPDGERSRAWTVDGVRCIWTPGAETKSASTLSFGLTSHLDASFRSFDVALVLNVANGYFLPLLRRRGIPIVLNTDGLEWTRGKWGATASWIFRKGAELSSRWSDVIISDSRRLAEIWQEEFGVDTRFIPYGAVASGSGDHDRIRELGLEARSYVLAVARIAPENNVDLTLDALELLPDVPAVVVGSANYDSPTQTRLRKLADDGKLIWLGHVDDQELLTQLWSNAGSYIHGHSVGGTNPALLQALGAGAPTLAIDTPFNREVLVDQTCLYPPDPRALAQQISTLLDDSLRQNYLSERGMEIIRSRYSWEDVFNSYEVALRDAINIARSTFSRSRDTASA